MVFIATVLLLFLLLFSRGEEQQESRFVSCDRFLEPDGNSNSSKVIVGRYARYDEMLEWMNTLCCLYPEIVRSYNIGQTSEGRSMIVLQLGFRRPEAWSIWLDGGIHAREHISPATIIYIADRLIQGYRSKEPVILEMLKGINWYMLPVFNPDGYEYSHTNTKSRLWRKNRRRINELCVGVDLNRNWDVEWGGDASDNDPCSEMYAGNGPATEAEVRNTIDFLLPRASEFIAFLTYHSFGQRIFTRWDYSANRQPEDNDELLSLGNKISDAIGEVYGVDYKVGQAPKLSYAFGGGSADWAKAIAGIKYSYLIELRDTGYHGFLLPDKEILPTGMENFAGIQALSSHIMRNHAQRNLTSRSTVAHKTYARVCTNSKNSKPSSYAGAYHSEYSSSRSSSSSSSSRGTLATRARFDLTSKTLECALCYFFLRQLNVL